MRRCQPYKCVLTTFGGKDKFRTLGRKVWLKIGILFAVNQIVEDDPDPNLTVLVLEHRKPLNL